MIRIPQDYIRVYISETDALNDPAVYDRMYQMLPDFRKKKADSYKVAEARNQSVVAFCLLMYGLEKALIQSLPDSEYDKSDLSIRIPQDNEISASDNWISPDNDKSLTSVHTPQAYEVPVRDIWTSAYSQITVPEIWNTLDYQTTETGKPYFAKRPDIHFSLSHTKGAVMCVISGSEVGCDIERIDRRMNYESVASRVLTGEELDRCMTRRDHTAVNYEKIRYPEGNNDRNGSLSGLSYTSKDSEEIKYPSFFDPKEFFRIWTRKEAYSKYTGLGVKQIADRFDPEKADAHIVSGESANHIWSVASEFMNSPLRG